MWQLSAFVLGSLLLLYISRQALRRPRSHGFYRFFAWEAILGLFLLNVPAWFVDWLSWHQLIAWVLLFASLVPLVFGVQALRQRGHPDSTRRSEPGLMRFERTTKLVVDGIYRYIRHPLYSSLFLLSWGIFFKLPSLPGLAMALAASLLLVVTARADEAECIDCFGEEYRQYMQHTHLFIPYIF